jgi:hypothetical protein
MVYANNYNYEQIISYVSKNLNVFHIFIVLTTEGERKYTTVW